MDRWKNFIRGNHVEVTEGVCRGERGRIITITVAMNLHFIHVALKGGGTLPFRPSNIRPLNALEELAYINEEPVDALG